ncbi:MAG: MATE family efflux transporter [Clostridiales bacterium]|nr:MAG: MATE family efflux transporter [Clostridiales bacterium]
MENREKLLREESIGKLLFKLSLPAMVGMMVNALYNMVDTIFVGNGVGALAIGGLTVAFPIQMAIMSLALLVGIGAQANISISFGAGQIDKANQYAGNAYALMTIIAITLSVLGLIFIVPILQLFGASATLLPYARDYMQIIFFGSVALSLSVVNSNVLRAEGNAKMAMVLMIIGMGLNIILDPIFIFGFKMGIRGAALATVISQFVGLGCAVYYMSTGNSIIKISRTTLRLKFQYVRDIIKLGFPTFIRQIAGSILAIFLNNGIVFYGGDIALSAFGIINRVMMFLFLPMFGIVQGFQPIAGFNYGALAIDRVKQVVKTATKALIVYCVTGLIVILTLHVPILRLFTDDQQALAIGAYAIKIMFLGIPIVGLQIISASFFQAIGKAKPALVLSLMRQVLMLLPLIIIMPQLFNLGLTGIWLAFPLSDIASTLISILILRKEWKALDHLAPSEQTT